MQEHTGTQATRTIMTRSLQGCYGKGSGVSELMQTSPERITTENANWSLLADRLKVKCDLGPVDIEALCGPRN